MKTAIAILGALLMVVGVIGPVRTTAEANQMAQTEIAQMGIWFSPEAIRLPNIADSGTVTIEVPDLPNNVWAAGFSFTIDPAVVEITSFRCEGSMGSGIRSIPVVLGNDVSMGCLTQPGQIINADSPVVANITIKRVGPGDTTISFQLEGELGTQFYSYPTSKLVPGLTKPLTVYYQNPSEDDEEAEIPIRHLFQGEQAYLRSDGQQFLYFNGPEQQQGLSLARVPLEGELDPLTDSVGLLIGGEITRMSKTSKGGINLYISPQSEMFAHVVTFPMIPYGTSVQIIQIR